MGKSTPFAFVGTLVGAGIGSAAGPLGTLKGGQQNVVHYHATFAFTILETGLTFPDGRQVERAIVVDRVWMADKVVWQSKTAVPIPAWSSATAYAYGDHVTRSGYTWTSAATQTSATARAIRATRSGGRRPRRTRTAT